MIGVNIRKLRESKGLSINALAKKCNMSAGYLSDIEKNKKANPTIELLEKIAKALNVSVDEFFQTSEEDNENKNESIEKSLPVIPEEFTDPKEARAYVDRHTIFGSEGFDPDRLDDNEILEFANALLEQMRMVSYKYKK